MKYFLAVLPQLDGEFYRRLNFFYELGFFFDMRLPLHVTIYYFGDLTDSNHQEISIWMDDVSSQYHAFEATITGVKFFLQPSPNQDKINVIYLAPESPVFHQLNSKLLENFPTLNRESRPYTPHLSLVFPHHLSITPTISDQLNEIFAGISTLKFHDLGLFASQNGSYILLKKIQLHG